ncbi:uncharacterized protein BDZ99DRAFT_234292 [Mytilinidion resinicola]|uniref:Zn(2)-C6 fungal-type domain-containing protein n=1 Tax=Mytilinidion resinicola TaxID=574789 RepID=A0A6A6Z1U0_9PEZI|nr:uncharacterized protein BDZ99DRAFT_234292 [Mytilinidion resinicola]KAF2814254.1 hypothetical protein BDZ99DRAFT_234292 [Mytilinidion resinicola]
MSLRARQNCWTCKDRKIGCDRILPTCQNCSRTNRLCQGYGMKLAWPDTKSDGRRKQKRYSIEHNFTQLSSRYRKFRGGLAFLNTTAFDVKGIAPSLLDLITENPSEVMVPRIMRSLSLNPTLTENDGLLLSYYDTVLARMITTIDDDNNGFRTNILPMALSSEDSTKSLLKATLALASFHLSKTEDAIQYKMAAFKRLCISLWISKNSVAAQAASCMMLCVYSVFDPTDSSWPLHLKAAKDILKVIPEAARTDFPLPFLSVWVDYHDILSEYSQRYPTFSGTSASDVIVPSSDDNDRKIVGLLGCSPEVMRLIGCINHLRALIIRSRTHGPDSGIVQLASIIRYRLQGLNQEVSFRLGQNAGTVDAGRVRRTAEFYRIGALLYLHQVAPESSLTAEYVPGLVREAFELMDWMEICTSPWPLFMLACHVTSDIDRIRVLDILDSMDEKRRIGNVQIVRGIIKTLWKQNDLRSDQRNEHIDDWRDLIDTSAGIPSFI